MGEIIYQMLVLVFFLTLRHKGTMSADVPQGDTASLNKGFARLKIVHAAVCEATKDEVRM